LNNSFRLLNNYSGKTSDVRGVQSML